MNVTTLDAELETLTFAGHGPVAGRIRALLTEQNRETVESIRVLTEASKKLEARAEAAEKELARTRGVHDFIMDRFARLAVHIGCAPDDGDDGFETAWTIVSELKEKAGAYEGLRSDLSRTLNAPDDLSNEEFLGSVTTLAGRAEYAEKDLGALRCGLSVCLDKPSDMSDLDLLGVVATLAERLVAIEGAVGLMTEDEIVQLVKKHGLVWIGDGAIVAAAPFKSIEESVRAQHERTAAPLLTRIAELEKRVARPCADDIAKAWIEGEEKS